MKLSTRLTATMVGLVLLTAAAVGLLSYRTLAASLLPLELDRLGDHAHFLAAELGAYAAGARAEILAARGSAPVAGLVRAREAGGIDPLDGSTEAAWRERLVSNLTGELAANPSFVQYRLIGVADGGREIVRVVRSGADGAIRAVFDAELQAKGDRDSFTATIGLGDGEVYVSPIDLNRERGVVETPHLPVLRVATPIHTPAGRPFGVLIINLDLRPILGRLRSAARPGGALYLVDERGDYLLHPDPAREFGFDLGRRFRLQDDLLELAAAVTAEGSTVRLVRDPDARELGAAVAPVRPAGGPRVAVVETVPRGELLASVSAVGRSSLVGGLGAALVALVLAVVLARSLGRPLAQMTAAVEAFARGEPRAVPTGTRDEIGVLARAFERMSVDVRDHAAELQREVEERERADERFRLAVEASPSGMVMVNDAGTVVLVNAEAERLFGYRRDELIGQPVEILVPERFRGGHPAYRREFGARPEVRRLGEGRDLYGRRRDGVEIPVEIGLNPVSTREGLMVLSVIVDISERKAAEAALAARTAELERSNTELEEFAHIASHDLQEPLRMMASYTELLGQRYRSKLDESADTFIHYAVDGARRMQRLIEDLLAFSRVGSEARLPRPTASGEVVREVVERLRLTIEACGGEVVCGDLPTIDADEVQLGQVFQNLIGNALKFRSDRPPRVHVDAAFEGGRWVFSVADNGVGIDEQYADAVFKMFRRLHERDKYEGSGIGLAIVRKIVERHGGKVWFESTPGSGTVFHFTMPPVPAAKS